MKIIIFATDFASTHQLMQEIKKAEHLVVETVDKLDQLIHEIARTTPHLLVALALAPSVTVHLNQVRALFPDLSVCLLSEDLSENPTIWQQKVQAVLVQSVPPPTPRSYTEETRYVCHDESLQAFWQGKLNRPKQEEGWKKIYSQQEARFVLQLQTGRKNHPAAKRYFECLLAQQSGLDQELAYRLAHGSYKALSWSRDLAAKWLALLAHYVPDVELEYLPIAGTPGPTIDYVHHNIPVEEMYAAALVILSTVKPTIANAIKELVTSRFEKQDDDTLFALSLKLYGMAKFLEQVGHAQIELMEAWLDPTIVSKAGNHSAPREENRNAGIYRDFHDLTFIVLSPEPLASVLRGFHTGTTYVKERRYLPSFAEFRRLCRHEKLSSDNPAGK